MNAHLLVIVAYLLTLVGLVLIVGYWFTLPARAHTGTATPALLPPPPAYAIALRLLAHGEYQRAVEKLQEVESSATYRDTPYAAESVYLMARVYRDNIHDNVRALTAYETLVTTYGACTFPHKAAALGEQAALRRTLDAANAKRPLYRVLDFFVRLTGSRPYSFATALLLISITVRLALLPLTLRQFRSAREMQALQPHLIRLQVQHKNDPQRLHQETLKLQREHGVNPMLRCLLGLAQAPIFWAMYQAVSLYQYHFSHGTFFWIGSTLSAHFPQYLAQNLALPDLLLLALYGVSMYVTQRLMPAGDPEQAQVQKATAWLMPVMFVFWIGSHQTPSAFVLYWLISNLLSTGIQLYQQRPKPLVPTVG